MKQYQDLLRHIIDNGTMKADRTGTGCISVFGHQMRFDLSKGFPLVTTKKVYTKAIIHELLWFLSGNTNIKYLQDNGVTIWDEWSDKNGNLGPVYGTQWRYWNGDYTNDDCIFPENRKEIDQIANVINEIKTNPDSRRLIVSAWNVADLDKMALQPCHTMFQFYVAKGKLSCQLYQRSADVFLGLPFNIASYALLTHMISQVCGLGVGEFIHTIGDAHLYMNHIDQAMLQLSREPKELPVLVLNPAITDIDDFTYDDISIENYTHHEPIKAKVSV